MVVINMTSPSWGINYRMKNILLYIIAAIALTAFGIWLDPFVTNSTNTQGEYTGSEER